MGYPSDINDEGWELIRHHFDCGNYGNRSKYDKRDLLNAVCYVIKTGCQWRFLPKDFPPWKTVYSFYLRAKRRGIWEKILQTLVKQSRLSMGALPTQVIA